MRILISIAHHRECNRQPVLDAVAQFGSPASDGFEIDVVIDGSVPLEADGADVRTWEQGRDALQMLAHRWTFAQRLEDYDVFAFSDDAWLLQPHNLEAFARASETLPTRFVAGFLPIIAQSDGTFTCPTDHGPHHWRDGSTIITGDGTFAEFTNPFSGCYALTRDQLHTCLSSGHYLTAPRTGRADIAWNAATDPYTRCGLTRLIKVDELEPFLVRHSQDGRRDGSPLDEVRSAADVLSTTVRGSAASELLPPTRGIHGDLPPKSYHESLLDAVIDAVPADAQHVLVVGTGSGNTESALIRRGHVVTVVPLDGVVGALNARRGLESVSPSLEDAFHELAGRQFDAIILSDILHRFTDPVAVLAGLYAIAATPSVVIATVDHPASLPEVARWSLLQQIRNGPTATPRPVRRLDLERWFVTAGFTRTTSARCRVGRGDPSANDRILLTRGSKSPVISPRETTEPVRGMVSLGLPVYNGMPYLVDSLNALRNQTYPNLEIVISDNGSTDGTEAFCRTAAEEDARIRYFRQPVNRGAAFNYNFVFLKSRGEYFSWTAHDDLRHERNVERCVAELERLPASFVTVASSAVFIDDSGSLVSFDLDDNSARGESPPARLRHVLRNVNRVNSIWGVTRASALERTNLIAPFIGSDYVLLAELALLGQVHVLDEQLFSRRLHAGASRAAHVSKKDVARWFDVNARAPVLSAKQRLAIEYWRAVSRVGLARSDRLAARPSIPVVMTIRQARVRGGAVKRWARDQLGAR
jgi:hypothetical protein